MRTNYFTPWLAPSQVVGAIRELNLPVKDGLQGYELPARGDGERFRFQRGSGIAGRSFEWLIVSVRTGEIWDDMPCVTRMRELRFWLRAYMTGEPRPQPRPGIIAYPKLNHNRFGDSFIWVERKASFARCGGTDEHPPRHCQDCPATERRSNTAASPTGGTDEKGKEPK